MTAPEAMPHDRAIELLPWLANDSLEDLERDAVREHASSCVVCRQELEQLEALAHSFAASAELNEVVAPDMRRINARIKRYWPEVNVLVKIKAKFEQDPLFDDAARKSLLAVFELLGEEDELVATYRRKLSSAML